MSTYQCEYVYCADIGSMQTAQKQENHFGWAGVSICPNGQQSSWREGDDMQELANVVAEGLNQGAKVALGFECPLWVPVRDDPKTLTLQRYGEGNPSWASQTAATVLTTGLAQVSWILQKIREKTVNSRAFLDWNSYRTSKDGLFIWEAFVSGEAKADSHIGDAKVGVAAFFKDFPSLETSITEPPGSQTRSLIGAALLWASWSKDLSLLHQPCTVIKA